MLHRYKISTFTRHELVLDTRLFPIYIYLEYRVARRRVTKRVKFNVRGSTPPFIGPTRGINSTLGLDLTIQVGLFDNSLVSYV